MKFQPVVRIAYLQSFYQKPVLQKETKRTKVCTKLKRKAKAVLSQSYKISTCDFCIE